MTILALPVELLSLIAIGLPDKDLCSFILACGAFYRAVQGDQGVWRSRFLRIYDEPVKSRGSPYDWRTAYQKRQRLFNRKLKNIEFQRGETENELEALVILRDVLLDAYGYSNSETDEVHGRNFTLMRLAPTTPSLFLSRLFELPLPHPLLSAVSLFLMPVLDLPEQKFLRMIQQTVYNPSRDRPGIYMLSALARFFTWHLHPDSESDLFHQRTLLTPREMPNFWVGRLGDEEREVPVKWFGAYTYLNFPRIMAYEFEEIFTDISDNFLVEMTLSLSPQKQNSTEVAFTATGRDFTDFTVTSGRITPITPPPDLEAITGWKKVCFSKNYKSHGWYYEGVMLPGNHMILGHWRRGSNYPFARGQSGPFCFWSVPESSSLRFRDNRLSLNRVGTV